MRNLGFYKIAATSLDLRVGDTEFNTEKIKEAMTTASGNGAKILLTPEMSVCGYTCGDLFFQQALLYSSMKALHEIAKHSAGMDMAVVVGLPVPAKFKIFNCAVVVKNGEIIGAVPKEFLANNGESFEKRWFASGHDSLIDSVTLCNQKVPFGKLIFEFSDELSVGVEICEDLWSVVPPSSIMALSGANLILNLSASSESVSKAQYRKDLVSGQSARCICGYAYAGSGVKESTTDTVYSGATIIAENGILISEGQRFKRETEITYAYIDVQKLNFLRRSNTSFADGANKYEGEYSVVKSHFNDVKIDGFNRFVDPTPFIPANESLRRERCSEILNIQSAGLAKRLEHTGMTKCVVGISGGLDSTLALLVSVEALKLLGLPSSNVIGVTMPGFGTTDRTYNNSIDLMKSLGVTIMEISIKDACIQHFKDIGHSVDIHDVTYENTQARERTQVLMDLSNKHGGILVGTGDLSEVALGWSTYSGDHMSMYSVNAGVPKTLVRYIVSTVADNSVGETSKVLRDVLDTPVSPELLPPNEAGEITQKTEDKIGPYELHDFFLYHFIRSGATKQKIAFLAKSAFGGKYSESEVEKWLTMFIKRFFASQFKRSCVPDGPKVGSVSLSPRGDWKMSSDAESASFLMDF